jgi:uncharacterized paraquat-inducible protein A
MSIQLQAEEVLENHSRLNEKQRKIEEAVSISIEEYKSKILCLQCGKESEKIKCQDCSSENIQKRNSYLIFSGSWMLTSVILFFTSNVYTSIPIGLCCGTVLSTSYNTIKNF